MIVTPNNCFPFPPIQSEFLLGYKTDCPEAFHVQFYFQIGWSIKFLTTNDETDGNRNDVSNLLGIKIKIHF